MTFTDAVIRTLLKAVLYAGLIPLVVTLDMAYATATDRVPEVCRDKEHLPGEWDCSTGTRYIPPGHDTLNVIGSSLGQLP
jgi:hypothetical protein